MARFAARTPEGVLDEVEHYVDLLDAAELADGWTTATDVDATKPEPDLVEGARRMVGGAAAVMIGDSTWDCEAGKRAGVETIAVLTGGFSERSSSTPAPRASTSPSTSCGARWTRRRSGTPRLDAGRMLLALRRGAASRVRRDCSGCADLAYIGLRS